MSRKMIGPFRLCLAVAIGFCAVGLAAWAVSLPVDDWKIAGPFGGTATAIALDAQNPKVILAGGRNSLLFASQDSGANWNRLNLPKRNFGEVTSILVDPADSKHYLVGMIGAEGAGIFETHDEGESWTTVNDVQDVGVRALAASSSTPSRFVAGSLRGVMLSDDSGKSWKRISDPQNLEMQGITAVAIDPKEPNIIYAGTAHLPWRTLDGGKTWESIHNGMIDDSDVFSIYIDPANPTNVFASACSGIYATTSRGDVWRKLLGIPNTSRRTHVVRQDLAQPGTIFAGTTLGVFKSGNGGTSWKLMNGSQVNAIALDPSHPNSMYLAMEYDGIAKSDDHGERIRPINNGFVDRNITAVTVSGKKMFAVDGQEGDTSGVFMSADRGESWSPLDVGGLRGVHLHAITGAPGEDRMLLAASPRQLYKSIDGGVTWKPLPVRLFVGPPPETSNSSTKAAPVPARSRAHGGTQRPVAKSSRPSKPKIISKQISPSQISGLYSLKNGTQDLLFAATDLGLLKSADLGEHWTLVDLTGSTAVYALFLAPVADGRLLARAGAGLYESKDFGDHWSQLLFPLATSEINDVAVPSEPNAPLLVATRLGLYSSPDNGVTWYPNSGKLPGSTVNSVTYSPGEPNVTYAVQYGQLYESKDCGNSWSAVSTALRSLHIRQLWIPAQNSDRLYGITNDLGILFRK
ncbi:MAG: WD40/YVTN/BNR-like repeat-containing protein [Bryobacteraceae bacterium]